MQAPARSSAQPRPLNCKWIGSTSPLRNNSLRHPRFPFKERRFSRSVGKTLAGIGVFVIALGSMNCKR